MKFSSPKHLTRRAHLIRQIATEQWPVRLGDFREVQERCDLLADTAPHAAGILGWPAQSVMGLLQREGLIGYDTDSGLWYCFVVEPRQDYPDGWHSEALIERKKRQAERKAWALKNPEPGPEIPEPETPPHPQDDFKKGGFGCSPKRPRRKKGFGGFGWGY